MAGAKDMLNSLWGALCEESKSSKPKPYNVKSGGEKFPIKDGMELIDFDVSGQYEKYTLAYSKRSITFVTPFARIKPFVTSAGRLVIANLLHEHQDKVLRVHTDGFISTEKLEFSTMIEGTGLCQVKVEHEGHLELRGINDMDWSEEENDEIV